MYSGLRIGELLALSWEDIDFEKGILAVSKTCRDGNVNGKHVKISDTPKTENSRRQIPLSKTILKMLKDMKKRSKCEFVIADGQKPVFVRTYQRMFELLLIKLKLPHNVRYSWGNFKNLKSKLRKQRVRKRTTEVFSVVLLFILRLFLFKFSNEYIYSPKCHLVVI